MRLGPGEEMAGLGIAMAIAAPTKVWGNSSMCYDFSMNWVGVVFLVFGFVVSSFWVWRKMRGEYEEEEILTMLLGVTGVGILAAWGWKWWSIWGIVMAVVVALAAWCRLKKWDIWEWLDVMVRASMVMGFMVTMGSGQWIKGGRLGIFWGLDSLGYGWQLSIIGGGRGIKVANWGLWDSWDWDGGWVLGWSLQIGRPVRYTWSAC